MASSEANALFSQFQNSIIGAENARIITIALFAWMVYEYLITLDDERKHFWKGPFSVSHALFFCNRYFPPCLLIFSIICYTIRNPTADFCRSAIQLTFFLNLFGTGVIKAILITRNWFLFPGDKFVQFVLLFAFLASFFTSMGFLYISTNQLQLVTFPQSAGCHAMRPPGFWRIYLPSLVLHTGLYIMAAHQAITNPKRINMRGRLLADGGVFYFVVLLSIGFTSIGSALIKFPQINIPAIFSPIVLTTNSIATTRIMFSLRSAITNVEANLGWLPTTPMSTSMPKSTTSLRGLELYKMATLGSGNAHMKWKSHKIDASQSTLSSFDDEEKGLPRVFTRVGGMDNRRC